MLSVVGRLTNAMKLRVHRFTPLTKSEGPGVRACIQVQGCPIQCAGCGVPQTWSSRGGALIETDALIDAILSGPAIEGVSFLGGEPFAQAGAVAAIADAVRKRGLSVVTFTGYLHEDLLKAQRLDFDRLLDATDLLIDGPFDQNRLDFSRPWVGSSNQRYHFLTDRYAHLADGIGGIPNRLEIRIGPDGNIIAGGLAPPQLSRQMLADVAKSLG
jgi:anaerobic ribonucleoside-triphosphate reductase activating protein